MNRCRLIMAAAICLFICALNATASPFQLPSSVVLSMHYDASALAVAGAPVAAVDALRAASAGQSQLLSDLATASDSHRAALAAVEAERRQMAAAHA